MAHSMSTIIIATLLTIGTGACSGSQIVSRPEESNVAAENAGAAAQVERPAKFRVVNSTGHSIISMFRAVKGEREWNEIDLGTEQFGDGKIVEIDIPDSSSDDYRLKAILDDGTWIISPEVKFQSGGSHEYGPLPGSPVTADHERSSRMITVVNTTGHSILRLYASVVGCTCWPEDCLGSDTIPVGQALVLDFSGGDYCSYDTKIVLDDGTEIIKLRINTCEVSEITVGN